MSGHASRWLLGLSAPSPAAIDAQAAHLGRLLRQQPDLPLRTLAASLARRPQVRHRLAVVASSPEEAAGILLDPDDGRAVRGTAEPGERSVVFVFPGVGDHYPGMVSGLYGSAPAFRRALDECAESFLAELGTDLRDVLGLGPGCQADAGERAQAQLAFRLRSAHQLPEREAGLDDPTASQPMLFAVEYALARLLGDVGLSASAVLGYSVGECTAMCLAGVLDSGQAARFVAGRAQAIEGTPPGAMSAVLAGADLLAGLLDTLADDNLAVGAVLGSRMCVVSGREDSVGRVEHSLADLGVAATRLPVRHAFHSPLMNGATSAIAELAATLGLAAPRLPILSNVTGDWLTAQQATDPWYWAGHARSTVRFFDNLALAWSLPRPALIEVGPGRTLGTFARTHPDAAAEGTVISLLAPASAGGQSDVDAVLAALATAWVSGLPVDLGAVVTAMG